MPAETHSQIASFIWSICNLLRGPYKRNEYRKVILPLTVLRRFDLILAPTKAAVPKEHAAIKAKGENITIDVIYSESLREIWFALPSLPEQAAIAAFLDKETT